MRASRVSLKISRKELRYPNKTFKGRERVSLVPRWVGSWVTTLAVSYLMFSYVSTFLGFHNPISKFISGGSEKKQLENERIYTPMPQEPILPPMSFYVSSEGQSLLATQTALVEILNPVPISTIQPTLTPLPTQTPYATQVKLSALGEVYAVGYSYYFPPFGPPNCSEENWHSEINYCDDMTASGKKWSEYLGIGVAVPYEWREKIPLGSVVRVLNNTVMQGDYEVIDYCGSCIKPEGHIYFDFLDKYPRLAWTVPLLIEVISVP